MEESIILTKEVSGHSMGLMVIFEGEKYHIISQCNTCATHHHSQIEKWDEEAQMFIESEVQLHASGIDAGWHDGIGFILEEDTD